MPNKHDRPPRRKRFGTSLRIALISALAMGGWSAGPPQATAQPHSANGEASYPPVQKEELRYAGRDFDQWRRQLVTDLEPKTQIAAIEALRAFGKTGYQEEAVAALGQVLATNSSEVHQASLQALGEIGAAAVPVLLRALRDKRPFIRAGAAGVLARIGPASEAALDPLRQAVQDEDRDVRCAAAQSLASVGAGEKRLLPAFEQLARSTDVQMRLAVLRGLSEAGANEPRFVPLLLRAMEDDYWEVRQLAGRALIRVGPPSREVIEGLMKLLREDLEHAHVRHPYGATSGSLLLALVREERNLATVAPVLVEAAVITLANPMFLQQPWMGELLTALARIGSQAAPAVPALAEFIAIGSPAQSALVILAIDALAAIGEAAREATPALEAWLAERGRPGVDVRGIQRHAIKALRSIND